jgi:3-phenylpropionate/cinnamic acid dioxygenase small subunit
MAMLSRADAEDFLFHEAQLLDDRRFDAWLRLFTATGIYWLPIDADAAPDAATSLIYDEPLRREERVHRLQKTPAQAQMPPSRTQHGIGNVRVEEDPDGGVRVYSNQVVHELRRADYRQAPRSEQRALVGKCEHHLLHENGSWRIALKKVILLDRDMPIANLSFLF